MDGRRGIKPEKDAARLIALGRALRSEYDARMGPPSPRLAALLEQVQIAVQPSTPHSDDA